MQKIPWYLSFLSLFVAFNSHVAFSMNPNRQLKKLRKQTVKENAAFNNILNRQEQEAFIFAQLRQQYPDSSDQIIAKLVIAQQSIKHRTDQSFKCEATHHHE